MAFKSKVKVRDSDPGFKKLLKRLTGPDRVDIGVFAEQGSDLVIKAAANEFGTSTIPERSHLRAAIDEGKREIENAVVNSYNRIFAGKTKKAVEIGRLGLFGTALVVKKIDKGPFKANKPATVKRKGSSKPLIDTGRLRAAYTHRVVK
ncbi:MAG: hypothetical protein KAJ55_10610 [Anaerolineales bacterium]|nr:hypothetical protein [Anaerolineales bacterium]